MFKLIEIELEKPGNLMNIFSPGAVKIGSDAMLQRSIFSGGTPGTR
jgi:hypothetical protein